MTTPTGMVVIHDRGEAIHRIPASELRFARKYINPRGAVVIEYQLTAGGMHEIHSRPGGGAENIFTAICAGGDHSFERVDVCARWQEVTEQSP